eukprot:TRINITY_DN14594_c0_g1_i2.p1 TRINITY_DN14594_c0_g1~~TRINITY_DN14594_c0_g1_i2.p1  ORF type:complete len:323 (-),score=65.31 TRINITY_DN14594_c0_g1_i2:104-1072(-)
MAPLARTMARKLLERPRVRALLRLIFNRSTLAMFAGAALVALVNKLRDLFGSVRRRNAESLWRRHVDLSVVQACILTTEHLKSLGRVEKRTLFVKPISEVFRNEYIVNRVLESAEEAAASREPMLMTLLSQEDKWHVLNVCSNHISSVFAPYHVFFNEARRVESYYKSAWYCFTLSCSQTAAGGRWFITPRKPVGKDDVGVLRIRIVMMNEQELRDIASGAIEPPDFGFFNGRHESRWDFCQRFARLFERQLTNVSGSGEVGEADWGPNLCGRLSHNSRKKAEKSSSNMLSSMSANAPSGSGEPPQYSPEDNSILRVHVPFD